MLYTDSCLSFFLSKNNLQDLNQSQFKEVNFTEFSLVFMRSLMQLDQTNYHLL